MIEKASPVEMRKALEAVEYLKQAGLLFVPVPVLGEENHEQIKALALKQMDRIVEIVEKDNE